MEDALKHYVSTNFFEGKSDLATAFLSMMLRHTTEGTTVGLVSPQAWYQIKTYRRLRCLILQNYDLRVVCDLGPAAFHDMNWWGITDITHRSFARSEWGPQIPCFERRGWARAGN
jgi:hypothetical protein